MASHDDIIADEWESRAGELAEWAMDKLINRKDVWGQYTVLTPSERRREGRSYKAMTLPQKHLRGEDRVTIDKLTRHFASRHRRKPQIIGLHAKSKQLLPDGNSHVSHTEMHVEGKAVQYAAEKDVDLADLP